jgi:hypothetical protein
MQFFFRIAFFCFVSTLGVVSTQLAQANSIQFSVASDTLIVRHYGAERNCCSGLAVDVLQTTGRIDLFELETGPVCRCLCLFDLRYSIAGLAEGIYEVRVFDGTGSVLYGGGTIRIEEGGVDAHLATVERGECTEPSGDPRVESWGRIRTRYR